MVEDVVGRARLDHGEDADDRCADNERLEEKVDLSPLAHDADEQVEDEEERAEEHQALDHLRLDCADTARVDDGGADGREEDQEHRALEPARPEADPRVDEQRRHPADDDEQHDEPVGLEVEGHVPGQQVALDRDEEDDEDRQADENLPAQEELVGDRDKHGSGHHRRDLEDGEPQRNREDEEREPAESDRGGEDRPALASSGDDLHAAALGR